MQDLLFPPTCLGCRTIVENPGALCGACWPAVRFLERPWCDVLGVPFPVDYGHGTISPAAIAAPPPFGRARAAVSYDGPAREMVQALKYGDRTDLAPWMAIWMQRAAGELLPDAHLVVPVPLHRRRFMSRRFNQSAELARHLALRVALPFEPGLLMRRKRTRQQVGLGNRERAENVRGAFLVPEAGKAMLAGRRVLLVDDVFTTGATVAAATRALMRGGAAGVDVLTFARVLRDFRPDEPASI